MPDPHGFRYEQRKDDSVVITHHGRTATILRGRRAADFLADISDCSEEDAQHLMARLTGNYKRGNERTAKEHRRNR